MNLKTTRDLANDAEIMFAVNNVCPDATIDWYLFLKQTDPKFSAACDYLRSLNKRNWRYRNALDKCKRAFSTAYKSFKCPAPTRV